MKNLAIANPMVGMVKLSGDLTFATINQKSVRLCDFKKLNGTMMIDLSDVGNSDSAGLALMIEWIKVSQQHQCAVTFQHIPLQLLTLAELSGFDLTPYFEAAIIQTEKA